VSFYGEEKGLLRAECREFSVHTTTFAKIEVEVGIRSCFIAVGGGSVQVYFLKSKESAGLIICLKCECGTIYSMWIILRTYEGGCEARLARR